MDSSSFSNFSVCFYDIWTQCFRIKLTSFFGDGKIEIERWKTSKSITNGRGIENSKGEYKDDDAKKDELEKNRS